jgi:xanthine dehydrogenase YagR molybdenum-binding subunit
MIDWGKKDMAKTLGIPEEERAPGLALHRRRLRRQAVPALGSAAGGAGREGAGRPVKVALQRALMMNNTTHRPATIQRIRIGATREGRITRSPRKLVRRPAGRQPETAVKQTRLLYAGAEPPDAMRLATLDLPEGNAMRAPGEAPGMMALEIAMDEMAEKLKMDPVTLPHRERHDRSIRKSAGRKFSQRRFVECLRQGAERFGWNKRNPQPGQVRDGRWLIGMGMASAFRNNLNMPSAARVRLERDGR